MEERSDASVPDERQHIDSLTPPLAVTRRGFVAGTLTTGFALAVSPAQAQTVIKTDANGLTAGPVRIPVSGGEILAYRAMPAGRTGLSTILVAHEAFGLHEYIQDLCRRLAKLGHLAVAPDLFARAGDVTKAESIAVIVRDFMGKTPSSQFDSDLDATAAWAAKNGGDPDRLGITGFCWGGRVTWMYAAHDPKLKAAVAWYGPLSSAFVPGDKSVLDAASQIHVPVLGLYGAKDNGIPVSDIEKMRAALKAAGNDKCEFHVYADAGHAFHADYRPSYVKDAAEDGWKRMTEWFKSHGLV